jgi:hypothetical protein
MYEAVEKAKSILNVKTQRLNVLENTQDAQENRQVPSIGIERKKEEATLNELLKEANVASEEVEVQEQEKIENMQEIDEIKETKTEESQENKTQQEDMFKEERKIDLAKVFGNKK